MNRINYRELLVFTLLFLFISESIFLKLAPYILYHYDFLIGFDTGKYLYDYIFGLSTTPHTIDLWVEPGLNTFLSILNLISPLQPMDYYKFVLPFIISFNLITIVFLITKNLSNSSLAGLFSASYLASSSVFLNATFDSYYRQLFGTVILMTFLYFLDKFIKNKQLSLKNEILLSILGAGVIFSHRGISLLYVMILGLFFLIALIKKEYRLIKSFVIIFSFSMFFSSIYWMKIISDNITVIKDTILFSLEGKHGGGTTVKTLSRTDNQLWGYFTFIPTAFVAIFGLLNLISRKVNIYLFFTFTLMIYILIKATFSNRFLINLELFMAVAFGLALYNFKKKIGRRILPLIAGILVLNFIFTFRIAIGRQPYVAAKTNSFFWLESNIKKQNSLIVAPDALSTILGQDGYRLTIYEYKPKPKGIDSLSYTEKVLAEGFANPSLLAEENFMDNEIYVMFGDWNLSNPLPRAKVTIPVEKWDSSKYFEKIYEGDKSIRRIYHLKKQINE